MKTSQSIQLLDTNDTNISPIVGVESIFYEQAENNKRKTLSDKLLLSGKDGSLSINTVSYVDASDKNIIVDLSTSKLDGADGSLFKLDVTQVSMTDFMGVIEEMIEEGGGGSGDLGPVNASIRDISNRLANVSDNVDTIGQSVDELNTSFGILDTSVGKLWDSSKHNDASVKALWDSSMSGGGDVSINDIKIQDSNTPSHSIVNQTTKIADISIKTINNQSLIGLGNITISGDASIYDIRVGNSQQSVVGVDKIARINRSDFITDASVDAWNNGGLISGTSLLGTINNTPFIYGQNVNISADDVRDVKYGSRAQVYFTTTDTTSNKFKTIYKNTLLAKSPEVNAPGCWGILNIFSNNNANIEYFWIDYYTQEEHVNVYNSLSLSDPILIFGDTEDVSVKSPVSDNVYLFKNDADVSTLSDGAIQSIDAYKNVYLCGYIETVSSGNNYFKLSYGSDVITTDPNNPNLYYILIGYSYSEQRLPKNNNPSSTNPTTNKFHFYGGIPRIYKYNSQTQQLEEHHINESGGGSFDPSDINSSITEVSTRLNDVSTRLNSSVTNINSSITDISTRLYNVSTRLDASVTNINSSIIDISTRLNSSITNINSSIIDISTRLNNFIPTELKLGNNIKIGARASGTKKGLPIAVTDKSSDDGFYTSFWDQDRRFYLDYPIYFLDGDPRDASITVQTDSSNAYIYKANVCLDPTTIQAYFPIDGVTSEDLGKQLYMKGHVIEGGARFELCTGNCFVFSTPTIEDGYQYIPIGYVYSTDKEIYFTGGYVNNRIFEYKSGYGIVPFVLNEISILDSFNKTRQQISSAADVSIFFSSSNTGLITSHVVDIDLTADGPAYTGAKTPRTLYIDKLFSDYVNNILNTYPDAKVKICFWFKDSVSGTADSVRINFSVSGPGPKLRYSALLKTISSLGITVVKDSVAILEISRILQPSSDFGSGHTWYLLDTYGDPSIYATE